MRGALEAHFRGSDTQELVFVPEIGFRPRGTRVLVQPSEARVADTSVRVLAVAASGDVTEVLVEWERVDSAQNVCALGWGGDVDAGLVVGGRTYAPLRKVDRLSAVSGYALRDLTFPRLPIGTKKAELRVRESDHEWRVPLQVKRGDFVGRSSTAEVEHEGIILRGTAVARHHDQVVVALEAGTTKSGAGVAQIGSGGPVTIPPQMKMPLQQSSVAAVTLEDDRGNRGEELRRLTHFSRMPGQSSIDAWPLRIVSVFGTGSRH